MVYVECLLNSSGKAKLLCMFIVAAQRGELITTFAKLMTQKFHTNIAVV